MNARTELPNERAVADYFIFASECDEHQRWLADTLIPAGAVEAASLDPASIIKRIAALTPSFVLIDFSGAQAAAASALTNAVHSAYPHLPIVAVGTLAEPESALAALRAGVRDFIDLAASPEEALRIVAQVLHHLVEPITRHGKMIVLLGARSGVGVSTLAANLAALLQKRSASKRIALLDLGLPAGDGMLYLNLKSEFNFFDAVRNVRRFDQTFVQTALSRHTSGLAAITLPPDLNSLREISYSTSVALLTRLRAFFDQQIVDLGGFSNQEFVAHVARAADEIWCVCEPAIGPLVSAAELLQSLGGKDVDRGRIRLIVNKFDPQLGLVAEQIAQRLAVPLIATLPARHTALGRAANQGKLIIETAEHDPYSRALATLSSRLMPHTAPKRLQTGLQTVKQFAARFSTTFFSR